MKKCIHKLNLGFEPTFGSDLYYGVYGDFTYGSRNFSNCNYYGDFPGYSTPIQVTQGNKEPLRKLGYHLEEDSNCFECPSIKGKFNTSEPEKFSKSFEKLVEFFGKKGYKPSSLYSECENEGGGHIHISLKEVNKRGKEFKSRFLKNLYNFTINTPELNWLFNGPWDRDNANSLLNYSASNGGEIADDLDYIMEFGIGKRYPIIYRDAYETIEFRFFMMPRNLKEFKLHYDLCISIYNYIWNQTFKNKVIKNKYEKLEDIKNISKQKAKKNVLEIFKTLKVGKTNTDLMKKIKFPFLEIRYKYEGLLC